MLLGKGKVSEASEWRARTGEVTVQASWLGGLVGAVSSGAHVLPARFCLIRSARVPSACCGLAGTLTCDVMPSASAPSEFLYVDMDQLPRCRVLVANS